MVGITLQPQGDGSSGGLINVYSQIEHLPNQEEREESEDSEINPVVAYSEWNK